MLTLDTRDLPEHERADAVIELMQARALASTVSHQDPSNVFMATWMWQLGPLQLVHKERSGLYMDVTRTTACWMISRNLGAASLSTNSASAGRSESAGTAVRMLRCGSNMAMSDLLLEEPGRAPHAR